MRQNPKRFNLRNSILGHPGAVGRDGMKKSQAKSGPAREKKLAETSTWEHSFNRQVPERIKSLFF